MPLKFIRTEQAIEKKIKAGSIPKFYFKDGVKHQSNPYAIARVSTNFHGPTKHTAEQIKRESIFKNIERRRT